MANANAMNGLLGKIYGIMTAPSTVPGAVERRATTSREPPFISFCAPGIAVDDLDFGDLTTKAQVDGCSAFSRLVNSIPAVSGTWASTTAMAWDIYELAITQVDLPDADLSDKEQAVLKKAQDFLTQTIQTTDPFTGETRTDIRPTAQYQAYEKMFAAYASVVRAYNNSRITALSNPTPANVADYTTNGPLLDAAAQNAYSAWGSLGYRDYVTEANGIISSKMAKSAYAIYERLRGAFQQSIRSDFQQFLFHPTFVYPQQILGPQFDNAWSHFSFAETEIAQFESASSTSWGGGVGASFGLWSVGGSVQHTDSQQHSSADTSGFSLNVELIQVPIQRPWWSSWVFSSRGWKGQGPLKANGSISNGTPPLDGLMTLIPTSMILARNLKINTDMTHASNSAFQSTTNTSASVG